MSASDYSKLLSLEQSATANFTPTGTGATARTLNTKLREISSVKDYGATGNGSTDDSTAFSNAVKAADAINNIDGVEGTALPRADMCKVYVPAGTYNIANLVDTDNREVVYIIDQAAKFTSGSNNKLNGELVREGQFNINNYQHGSTDYSVTYAIRANVGSSTTLGGGDGVNAEILGVTAPNQLALYQDRDSVGLYVDNENALPLLNLSSVSSYAATSVTLTAAPSADAAPSVAAAAASSSSPWAHLHSHLLPPPHRRLHRRRHRRRCATRCRLWVPCACRLASEAAEVEVVRLDRPREEHAAPIASSIFCAVLVAVCPT